MWEQIEYLGPTNSRNTEVWSKKRTQFLLQKSQHRSTFVKKLQWTRTFTANIATKAHFYRETYNRRALRTFFCPCHVLRTRCNLCHPADVPHLGRRQTIWNVLVWMMKKKYTLRVFCLVEKYDNHFDQSICLELLILNFSQYLFRQIFWIPHLWLPLTEHSMLSVKYFVLKSRREFLWPCAKTS